MNADINKNTDKNENTDRNERTIRFIMLTQIKGLGPVGQNQLLNLSGGIENLFEAEIDELILCNMKTTGAKHLGEKRLRSILEQRNDNRLRTTAEEIYNKCLKHDITVITKENPTYPERMLGIPDMPVVLYTKGRLKINDYASSVGIVGARRCTREGKEKAIQACYSSLEQNNAAIISGMAKGIDSYAHTAAIKKNGYTIAVLGNGADICYPKEHQALYEEIALHGCILSEYPPETAPQKYRFPRRNKLIAALSDELIVIDAGKNSGTESTVSAAREYGRPLIFHNIFDTATSK